MQRYSIILMAALVMSTGAARAQSFTRIYGFGDSYADTNDPNDPGGTFQKDLVPPFLTITPEGRFSSGENFVDRLRKNFGIADENNINFAFGGALTDETGLNIPEDPPPFHPRPTSFLGQVDLASDVTFSTDDIVALSIGGNNMLALVLGFVDAEGPDDVNAFALESAAEAGAGVQTLVDQGARTITLTNIGDPAFFPALNGAPPEVIQLAQDFAENYTAALQVEMAAIAAQGVRVNFFDYAELQHRLFGDGTPGSGEAARFGFFDTAAQGLPGADGVPCQASPANGIECDPADAGTFFNWDGVHLTEAGYNLMADFMTIQLVQNETIPVQTELSQIQAQNFTEILHQRMQARRNGVAGYEVSFSAKDTAGLKQSGYRDRPEADVHDGLALFFAGGVGGGERDARDGIVGYDYDLQHFTFGGELKTNEHFYLGAAIDYTNAQADYAFLRGVGKTELDSVNLGMYASVSYPNIFADLAVAYSINSYDISRTGFVSPFGQAIALDTSAKTDGDSFIADFRTGYLFHSGALSFGPVAGVAYTNVTVDGYRESGDSLLTLNVKDQELESLIGSIGMQFRYSAGKFEPYVAVTLEKEFMDDFSYDFALTSADAVVNSIDVGSDNDPYGRVRAGIKAQFNDQITGSIDGSATFGREFGDDYAITGTIAFKF